MHIKFSAEALATLADRVCAYAKLNRDFLGRTSVPYERQYILFAFGKSSENSLAFSLGFLSLVPPT